MLQILCQDDTVGISENKVKTICHDIGICPNYQYFVSLLLESKDDTRIIIRQQLFGINSILPLDAILPSDIFDW